MSGERATVNSEDVLKSQYALPERASVHVYLSAHGTTGDAPHLAERIAEADILAPEVFAWNPDLEKAFNRIAGGNLKQYQYMRQALQQSNGPGSYTEALVSAFYKKRIPILMIDTPQKHPVTNNFRAYVASSIGVSEALKPDFNETLRGLQTLYGAKAGPITRQREDYMLDHLTEGISKVIDTNPRLHRKDNVKVLATLGADHTYIYHKLKKANPKSGQVTREFGHEPVVYTPHVSCLRAGQFGVEVTQDMAAGAYAELIINSIVSKEKINLSADHEADKSQLVARLIGSLSIKDVGVLHDTFRQTLSSGNAYNIHHSVVAKVIHDLTLGQ
jgi:hypothetical protein